MRKPLRLFLISWLSIFPLLASTTGLVFAAGGDIVKTKPPTCRPGYVDFNSFVSTVCSQLLQGQCCKGTPLPPPSNGYCEARDGSIMKFVDFRKYCESYKENAIFTPKNYCQQGGDLFFVYEGGQCVAREPVDVSRCLKDNTCNTAIGPIPTVLPSAGATNNILTFLLKWAFGISGAVIFLMVVITGYNVLTSSGNPEKLQAAKENVVSIFSGLILIIFSLVLLQAIGVDILQLPPFQITSPPGWSGGGTNPGGGGGNGSSGFN